MSEQSDMIFWVGCGDGDQEQYGLKSSIAGGLKGLTLAGAALGSIGQSHSAEPIKTPSTAMSTEHHASAATTMPQTVDDQKVGVWMKPPKSGPLATIHARVSTMSPKELVSYHQEMQKPLGSDAHPDTVKHRKMAKELAEMEAIYRTDADLSGRHPHAAVQVKGQDTEFRTKGQLTHFFDKNGGIQFKVAQPDVGVIKSILSQPPVR